ncbi:hypothetical protein WNY81_19395 [Shewanella frigidimarina]|uniref:hypothetical protein n=1 Tax=Shewanella frigidimarina TaxID=56812 RepID=UPI00317E4373
MYHIHTHAPVKNLYFKRVAAVLFFVSWLFTALFNPIAISTLLVAFLAIILIIFTFTCRYNYRVDTWVLLLLLLFFINACVNQLFMLKETVRWFIAFWCCLLSVYFLLRACGGIMILSIYKKIAIAISIFCIIQQLSFLLGINFLYDLTWLGIESRVTFAGPFLRVTAFFAEPAHLGFFLIYPTFIAIICKKNIYSLLVIVAFFMTFSVGNYLMLVSLLLGFYAIIEKRLTMKAFLVLSIIGMVLISLLVFIPALSQKFNSIFAVGDALLLSENRSKAAPYFLFFVNLNSLLDNPFFGNGFGTGLDIYKMYLVNLLGVVKKPDLFFSDEVFFAKIMGEMGGLGLLTFFFIFYNKWSKASKNNKVFLFIFLLVSLKSGSYFNPALFFFLNMYFFKEEGNRL